MKKKLMFLIESMIVGGAERVLIDLVNNLDPEKYDITIISVFKKSVYDGYDCTFADSLRSHIHYRYLVDNSNTVKYRFFNLFFNRCSKRFLHRILIGSDYDVEVAWYEGLPTTMLANSSNTRSKKYAWLHYGDGFKNLTSADRTRYAEEYAQYDKIIGVSNGVGRNFKEKLSVDYPVQTCYNIIEDELIRQKSLAFDVDKDEVTTFVSVGRLSEVKGYDRLLRVCKRLRDEGYLFRLRIIGEGGERRKLEVFITQNSLSGVVSLLGNQTNPFPYVKAADWLVSSSYAEGFSTVLTEACIIGTPIISTECLGTRELLGDSEYGIVTENSEDGIYVSMKRVLSDTTIKFDYTQKAKTRAKAFNKSSFLEQFEKLLDL